MVAFFSPGWNQVSASNVVEGRLEYKGTTADGKPLYESTYFDAQRQKYVSYCTVVVQGCHYYVSGSGREREPNTHTFENWDLGTGITWQEALNHRAIDLVR